MGLLGSKEQVGVYLDANDVAVVCSHAEGREVKIQGSFEVRTPLVFDSTPELKQQAYETVRLALTKAKAKGRNIMLTLPGEASVIRYFEIPPMPKKEELNAVRFEGQKYIPFKIDEMYYDYTAYPGPPGKRTGIVFFACKRERVDSLSALFELDRMKVASVELACNSLARAFSKLPEKQTQDVVLLLSANGDGSAEVVIQKAGAVLTTRHISLSLSGQDVLDVPLLASDIRLSLDYFAENFGLTKVASVFIATPFPGNLESVTKTLGSEFTLPVESGTLFSSGSQTDGGATGLAAAYGLTLGAIERRQIQKINLKATDKQRAVAIVMTWEEERAKLQKLMEKELIAVIAVLGTLFILFHTIGGSQNSKLQKAIATYPAAKTVRISEDENAIRAKEAEIFSKLAYLKKLVDERVFLTKKLNALVQLVPENFQLTNLIYRNYVSPAGPATLVLGLDGVVLKAAPGSELSSINKFVESLNSSDEFSKGFQSIKIGSTKKDTGGEKPVFRFSIECTSRGK